MATIQHFRTALGGFNRQDVVNYIEYLNNQHNSQIQQLNTQLQTALSQSSPAQVAGLQEQLDAANARIAQLEEQLQNAEAAIGHEAELETYRRAERAERAAQERSRQIYEQANAVLADTTAQADNAAHQIGAIADQVVAQLQQYQDAILQTKGGFEDAVATLYAIRPEEE